VATNLQVDDELIKKALELGGHKTKKEAVNAALKEYTERREQIKISSCSERLSTIRATTTRQAGRHGGDHTRRHIGLVAHITPKS
jgi:Arc/MetJ family transcription regulator